MGPVLGTIGIKGGYALAAITLLALPIIASASLRSGPAWQRIGKGRFTLEPAMPPSLLLLDHAQPPVDPALQAAETRQMLEAKSYRRRRRGEPALDVEAEMQRLLDPSRTSTPGLDERLRSEVRVLVIAQNERRMRAGRNPLDVEVETERQLADFIGLGK